MTPLVKYRARNDLDGDKRDLNNDSSYDHITKKMIERMGDNLDTHHDMIALKPIIKHRPII